MTARLWTGRVLSALAVMFLVFDGAIKLMKIQPVLDATAQLGFPADGIVPVALVLLTCTLLYVIPRTRVLGAIVLTGYLGGAVAAHVCEWATPRSRRPFRSSSAPSSGRVSSSGIAV